MERLPIAPELEVGAEQYIRRGEIVERRRVVKETFHLTGSKMCLTNQIEDATIRIRDAGDILQEECTCERCVEAKSQAQMDMDEAQTTYADLLELWFTATNSLNYPEK